MEVLGHRKLNQTRNEAQSPGRESGVKCPNADPPQPRAALADVR